jgi:GNAT superfamily N-acetyltransferase
MAPFMFDKALRSVLVLPRPIRELTQSLGFGSALLYGMHRVFHGISPKASLNSYYVVAQPIPQQPLLPGSRGASISVRFAGPGDPALALMERPAQEIAARFAADGVCLVAEKQGKMVGFLWLLLDGYCEPEDRCVFVVDSPRAAWDLDVFVEPSLRLSPVFAKLWSEANGWLRAKGIEWTLSRISCYNERSLLSHARLGSIKLGRMTFLKLGAMQIVFSSLSPYVHFMLGNASGPLVRLQPPSGA